MFYVCLCYAVLSVPCSLLITCWERADFLALLFLMFSCFFFVFCFFIFPYGIQGQVWYLVVSFPGLYLLLYCYGEAFHYVLDVSIGIDCLRTALQALRIK